VADDPHYIPCFEPVDQNPLPANIIDVRIENQEVIKPLEPILEEPHQTSGTGRALRVASHKDLIVKA
jgi:hypothetical protein